VGQQQEHNTGPRYCNFVTRFANPTRVPKNKDVFLCLLQGQDNLFLFPEGHQQSHRRKLISVEETNAPA
jgi:hypothetical protein